MTQSSPKGPTVLDKWASNYVTHDNDNPRCYEGTCRCQETLNRLGRELLESYGVKL